METLIIRPRNKEELTALQAVMKVLKIDFETRKNPYNPKSVAKILKSKEDFQNGKGVKIDVEDLWK